MGNGQFLFNGRPIEGVNPPMPSARPPLRPDVPCETQSAPDLRTNPLPPPPGRRVQGSSSPTAVAYREKAMQDAVKWLRRQIDKTGESDQLRAEDTPLRPGELSHLSGLGKLGHFKAKVAKGR